MRGIDLFCERCGARQPTERRDAAAGAGLARRLASAVNRTADGVPAPTADLFLRLCLECRGYSCPACWNEDAGVCQTCAPMPVVELLEPVAEPLARPVAAPMPAPVDPPAPAPMPLPIAPAAAEPLPPVPPTPTAPPFVPLPVAAAQPAAVVAPPPVDPVVIAPAIAPRPRPSIAFVAAAPTLPAPAVAYPLPAFAAATAVSATAYAERAYMRAPTRPMAPPSATGVRPCLNCDLPLSAKAHFCRRCGTAQES